MTTSPKYFRLLLGALLTAFTAGTEASVGEYRWGKTVCTPSYSKVIPNLLNGSMDTFLYAPTSSCRCERDPEERQKVEVRVDMKSTTVAIFQTDERGKTSAWDTLRNCRILSPKDWDCSNGNRGIHWIIKMSSDEGLILATINGEASTLKGKHLWGSCIRKDGWSLRGLLGG